MTVLQVDRVTFGYGAEVLFEDVSFSLAAGERMALVAPNGQGKSSLLKLLVGELTPDEGRVLLPKSVRVAYLHQSHEPDPARTVMEVLLGPFADALAAREALTAAEHGAAEGTDAALERLVRAQERFDASGAESIERQAVLLAQKVGFGERDLERTVASLSGGERGRLQLASVLAAQPDLLLLDEPTNHLDLETVEWLEGYLAGWPGAAIIVSHDRHFLDAVCTRVAELGLFRYRLYGGNYTQYLVAREVDLERERAMVLEQKQQIARTEDFVRRNLAGNKTNQAKSRRKMLEKLVRLDNPEDVWADARHLGLRFSPSRRSGDIVLEATGLGASRAGRELFAGVDLRVRRLERLAIVGPNGAGKSTLLRLLAGHGQPEDEGEVRRGTNLDVGFFDQHLESLDPGRSCIETVRAVRPELVVDAARQYLARFRFWGDDAFREVGSLSGGERTRLALACLLLVSRNFLLLDEPTNHLDIPACEILEEALVHFEGTLIVVSHDRTFLERVSTRVVHLDAGVVDSYQGNYAEYVAHRAKRKRAEIAAAPAYQSAARDEGRAGDKGDRKAQHEAARKSAREQEKRTKRLADLEKLLAEGEDKLKALRAELGEAPGGAWEKLAALAEREQSLAAQIDRWSEEWITLSDG